ncbi:winged helix-turn-helix transcriptional regulator [Listeria sp. FSL L7-1517]|uniref:MarR family winged helix-turn-helix transcriptional regulator n=1 Tax=Listeria immobilis TaxID=2713502 RepID=UPI00164DE69B|nr:MarR family winged helix-turn-helix transcriptional regulator [Listeria immobilis]MBC6298021.1 winged helix-turn-helix transcriptional regulator [Listeria immobilis]
MEFKSRSKQNSEEAIGLQFIKVYNLWHNQIKMTLRQVNLTHPQFIVLTSLGYLQQTKQEITQVMVAKISEMDVMTVSQVLQILEKKELILRQAHSTDTRAKALSLTEKGSLVMNQALPLVEGVDQEIFGALSEQQATFNHYLKEIINKHEKEAKDYD